MPETITREQLWGLAKLHDLDKVITDHIKNGWGKPEQLEIERDGKFYTADTRAKHQQSVR